jgi:hypothetical protein
VLLVVVQQRARNSSARTHASSRSTTEEPS